MFFKPHSDAQESVIFSEKPIVIAATGIQWGKTLSGVMWLKKMIHTYPDPSNNFLVTSPTFPIFSQSTLPPFLAAMDINEKTMFFRIRTFVYVIRTQETVTL